MVQIGGIDQSEKCFRINIEIQIGDFVAAELFLKKFVERTTDPLASSATKQSSSYRIDDVYVLHNCGEEHADGITSRQAQLWETYVVK